MASLHPITTIPMPPPPPIPYEQKSTPKLRSLFQKAITVTLFLVFFVLIFAFAMFLVLLLCLLRALLQRLHLLNGPATIDADNNDSLAYFRVDKGTRPEPDDAICVVCLEGFQIGECCRKLVRCGHVFHSTCVDAWLVRVATCPTCRTPVRLSAETEDEEGRQLWISAINDMNDFIALKLHFLAYRLCRVIFAPCT